MRAAAEFGSFVTSKGVFAQPAGGFYGSEPGENRRVIQCGPINSWSSRLWFFPTENWAAQVSFGRLAHPEALEPGDQTRMNGLIGMHATRAAWKLVFEACVGRTHSTATLRDRNSYLAESVLPVTRRKLVTGRFELVAKDELFSNPSYPEERLDSRFPVRQHISNWNSHCRLHARHRSLPVPRDRNWRDISQPTRGPARSSHTTALTRSAPAFSFVCGSGPKVSGLGHVYWRSEKLERRQSA